MFHCYSKHRAHIWVEKNRGSVSALSAGAYTATLYVMITIVKGGERAPPNSIAWANFSIMIECTPESGNCHSVCTLGCSQTKKMCFCERVKN
jgi:hypothetical protein